VPATVQLAGQVAWPVTIHLPILHHVHWLPERHAAEVVPVHWLLPQPSVAAEQKVPHQVQWL
jgi:hypothetical protein